MADEEEVGDYSTKEINVQVVDCHYLSDFLCCEYSSFLVQSPPAAFLVVMLLVHQISFIRPSRIQGIILIEGVCKVEYFVSKPVETVSCRPHC